MNSFERSDESASQRRQGNSRWLFLMAGFYALWMAWLAYVAWVNISSGNQ